MCSNHNYLMRSCNLCNVQSGRRLPPTPGEVAANSYQGTVHPPPNSAMLGRLPSLNGYSDSRPGSSGTRPGSSDSSLRAQYQMPVPENNDLYGRRQPIPPNRPPPGALPPQVPGYGSVYEDERPPSSPSDGYSLRGEYTARPGLRPYSPSQHSTSSYNATPSVVAGQSCTCYLSFR